MTSPYLIIPISVITFFLYFFTLTLNKLAVINKSAHRKIWNSLLLITFIVTALLGLLLAIQVNYKLQIPYLDKLIKWHVDFGIAMSIIAIIHFIWHWPYYRNIFKGNKAKTEVINVHFNKTKMLFFSFPFISLGFTATITQIIIIREFISIFSGNEIVIGLIITNWMIITGIGAYLGKFSNKIKNPQTLSSYLLFLLGLIPIITIFLLNFLKNKLFTPGIEIGIVNIWYTSFLLIIPFGLVNGYFFTFYSSLISVNADKNKIAGSYSYEAFGSIIGGLLFSFFLIYFCNNFEILSILIIVNSIITLFISKLKSRIVFIIIAFIITILSFQFDIDLLTKSFLFINQNLIETKQTPYGNLSVTNTGELVNFYANNNLLFTNEDVIINEEKVHYAMLQHPDPKEILLISGGIGGLIDEILKYDVKRIDYIEFDPYIIMLGNKYLGEITNEKVRIYSIDPYIFLKENRKKYDVVLINLPEPLSAQLNRFYTLEFYKLIKSNLEKDGIASFHLQSSMNYYSDEAIELHSTIFNTLKRVFKNILILPGENEYYIFSDSNLSTDIPGLLYDKNIENKYVNEYYLDNFGMQQRSSQLFSIINKEAQINTNFKPVAYLNQFSLWISKYQNYSVLIAILSIIVLLTGIVLVSRFNPLHFGMFTTGFTVASSEIIIILAFQILCGYVYHMLGIIISIYMAGLAIGAFSINRFFKKTSIIHFKTIQLLLIITILILSLILFVFQFVILDIMFIYIVFLIISLLISFLGGLFFAIAVNNKNNNYFNISSGIYSIDLIGSAIGTLIITLLFIPLLGILYSCLILVLLNSFSYLISLFTLRKIN